MGKKSLYKTKSIKKMCQRSILISNKITNQKTFLMTLEKDDIYIFLYPHTTHYINNIYINVKNFYNEKRKKKKIPFPVFPITHEFVYILNIGIFNFEIDFLNMCQKNVYSSI